MDLTFTGELRKNIKNVLQLSGEELDCLTAAMIDIGVECINDLQLVTEKDLQLLHPIQRRKLLLAWKPKKDIENIQERCDQIQDVPSNSINVEDVRKTASMLPLGFKVPWNKMPRDLMDTLNDGKNLKPAQRRAMIRVLADAIRKITVLPGTRVINLIALYIVQCYPALMDTLCGEIIAGGHSSLAKQLRNRLENLNRGTLHSKKNLKTDFTKVGDNLRRNCTQTQKLGFLKWNPKLANNETEESQEIKRNELLALHKVGLTGDVSLIQRKMSETFPTQRKDVNKSSIIIIKEKWPCLFSTSGMLTHFKELIGICLQSSLSKAMATKGNKIIEFLKSNLQAEWKQEVSVDVSRNNNNFTILIVLLIRYFKEDPLAIFKPVGFAASYQDIHNVADVSSTPCLIVCGESVFKAVKYMLFIDGAIVRDDIEDFQTALLLLFSAFFIFNINFPDGVSTSMEFLQKAFFNIHSECDKKDNKKYRKDKLSPRISTLLSQLSNFESI